MCDLVLVHAPEFAGGLGLDVHIRTRSRFSYSYIESAALKLGNDILEVSSFGNYAFNGVSEALLPLKIAGLYDMHHDQVNEKKHVLTFKLALRNA